MDQPVTIGLDLAKSVFQLHGVDSDGVVVLRRQLRRVQVLAFFERLSPALWGWKLAQVLIIGPGSSARSARSAMRSG